MKWLNMLQLYEQIWNIVVFEIILNHRLIFEGIVYFHPIYSIQLFQIENFNSIAFKIWELAALFYVEAHRNGDGEKLCSWVALAFACNVFDRVSVSTIHSAFISFVSLIANNLWEMKWPLMLFIERCWEKKPY